MGVDVVVYRVSLLLLGLVLFIVLEIFVGSAFCFLLIIVVVR